MIFVTEIYQKVMAKSIYISSIIILHKSKSFNIYRA